MSFFVSLQEVEMPWGFTHTFTEEERLAILKAEIDVAFDIEGGKAHLDKWGHLAITLRSPGGNRHHSVDYLQLRQQLLHPDRVELYARKK